MCRIFGHLDADAPDPGWGLGASGPADGHQPHELDARVRCVLDGTIHNIEELCDRLAARGRAVTGRGGAAVVPHLYAEFGPSFAGLLDGSFALALLDLRAEPEVVVATDDYGTRPVHYTWDPARRRLHFSSDLSALLPLLPSRPSLWAPGLDAYLATGTPLGEETFLDGVRVLPPGTTLTCGRRRGLLLTRRPLPEPPQAPVPAPGLRVRDTLAREVRRLAAADRPVCALGDGGLASGLVTALAARDMPGLHTFTLAWRGVRQRDDGDRVRQIAVRSGATPHEVEVDPKRLPDLLPEVARHLGQPTADPAAVAAHALLGAVRKAGFTVALAGEAADEYFCGHERVTTALAGGDGWIGPYVDSLAAVPAALRDRLYTGDYRAYVADRGSAADRVARRLAEAQVHRSRQEVLTAFETRVRLPAHGLRRVDQLGAAHSVEVRLPFCRPSVTRLARALPAQARLDGTRGRTAVHAAAHGLLPYAVLDRPRPPSTVPVTALLAPGTPLTAYLHEMLTPSRLAGTGLLNPAEVARLLRAHGERPCSTTASALWALLMFEVWRERLAVAPVRGPLRAPAGIGVLR